VTIVSRPASAFTRPLEGAIAAASEPVVSVDTKKKELVGEYANGGREWQPSGEPERVNVHDFADRAMGEHAKAIPYGVYDVSNDDGWVSVGDVADTAEFAVASLRRWRHTLGEPAIHEPPQPTTYRTLRAQALNNRVLRYKSAVQAALRTRQPPRAPTSTRRMAPGRERSPDRASMR
jgi:Rhodopirellula transposase DDE domain